MCEAAEWARFLLWLDASLTALRTLESVFQIIRERGYFLLHGDHKAGEWMSDRLLAATGRSREAFMARPNLLSGCFGLDVGSKVGSEILRRWCEAAASGLFIGDWTNEQGQVSSDQRVRGHRHDQSALDAITLLLNLDLIEPRIRFIRFEGEPARENQAFRLKKGPFNRVLATDTGIRTATAPR